MVSGSKKERLKLLTVTAWVMGLCTVTVPAWPADPGGHDYHEHTIGLFAGVTGENRRDSEFALGIDYSRRFSPSFGIGGIVEHAFGDPGFWIFAVPFSYYSGHWKWYAAPGIENKRGHSTEFLVRIGLEYAFNMGGYEIAPQIDVDFVDGETVYVVGVSLVWGLD